jgi:hypothetical protein
MQGDDRESNDLWLPPAAAGMHGLGLQPGA